MKKAVIIVKLVPESSDVSEDQIVKEMLAEAKDSLGWKNREGKCQQKCLNG